MSRDHYRGVPKTRDAIVRPDGTVEPLDKIRQDLGLGSGGASGPVVQVGWTSTTNIYARSTGSDTSGSGTLASPYRTLVRCLEDVPNITDGSDVFIDISSIGTETVLGPLRLPPVLGSRKRAVVTNGKTLRSDYRFARPFNIYAEPTVIQTFTVSSTASATTSLRKSYTLTGAGWVPDEHKGRFVIGAGQFHTAIIVGNTEDTIVVSANLAFTGQLSIVEPSATLKCDYISNPGGVLFAEAFTTGNVNVDLAITGVAFEHNASGQSIRVYGGQDNFFELCSFDGVSMGGSEGIIKYNGCLFNGQVDWERSTVDFDYCFFNNAVIPEFNAGNSAYGGCTLLGIGPLGSDPVYNRDRAHPNQHVENCTIVSGTGDGIVAFNVSRSFVGDTTIDYCAGDAISADRGANLVVRTVTGANNGGYGVLVNNAAQVEIRTGAVTGALGDFKVGTLLNPSTWAGFVSAGGNMLDVNTVSGTLSRMFAV